MIVVRSAHTSTWRQHVLPLAPIGQLWQHRQLIWQMAVREVKARYHGSMLGPLWSWVMPLLALVIYTFVFGSVLKPRGAGWGELTSWHLALMLLSGLLIFNSFSEMVGRASHLILGQPQFVKKVVFPLEILPLAMLLGMLLHLMISLSVVLLLGWWLQGTITWSWLWLPLILLPHALFLLGVGWFLAATAVFFRDLVPTMTALCQLLIFLTPVFYPLASVPEPYRAWMLLNPLAWSVELGRAALMGTAPPLLGLLCFLGLSWIVMQLGYGWFMFLRPRMADVV